MANDRRHMTVIGAGAWGTTLALLAIRAGATASLWVRDAAEAAAIERRRENSRFLPGVALPAGLRVTADLDEACTRAAVVAMVVPSATMRENIRAVEPFLGEAVIVSASKGLEPASMLRMTEVIDQELEERYSGRVGALSGPNLAVEIANDKPAATVLAGPRAVVDEAREVLMGGRFRCYASDDLVGVELAGALKNVYAIGAGIGDQLEAGDNAKAAFVNRAIVEIGRLGVAQGARPLTFAGLAGIGDLMATCASSLSRNNQLGRRLAAGETLDQIVQTLGHVAEGVGTTSAALALSRAVDVEMPIVEQMAAVLFEGRGPAEAIAALMERDARHELEGWA
ncbi:MAG: NAD(P)H-dependent glycerol-3-phosphate dehydrogenase [Thermomicrobiales bacterium]